MSTETRAYARRGGKKRKGKMLDWDAWKMLLKPNTNTECLRMVETV